MKSRPDFKEFFFILLFTGLGSVFLLPWPLSAQELTIKCPNTARNQLDRLFRQAAFQSGIEKHIELIVVFSDQAGSAFPLMQNDSIRIVMSGEWLRKEGASVDSSVALKGFLMHLLWFAAIASDTLEKGITAFDFKKTALQADFHTGRALSKIGLSKDEAVKFLSVPACPGFPPFSARKTAVYRGWRDEKEKGARILPTQSDSVQGVYYDPTANYLPYDTHPLTGKWLMVGRDSFANRVDTSTIKVVWTLEPSGTFEETRQIGGRKRSRSGRWQSINDISEMPSVTIFCRDGDIGIYKITPGRKDWPDISPDYGYAFLFTISWLERYDYMILTPKDYKPPLTYWQKIK